MKAITLWQPWASLIADKRKRHETRSWCPPRTLKGEVMLIHAGKTVDKSYAKWFGYVDAEGAITCPTGCFVATARLYAVCQVQQQIIGADGDELAICNDAYNPHRKGIEIPVDDYGNFAPGRFLWEFIDVSPIVPPTPARGRQKIWDVGIGVRS